MVADLKNLMDYQRFENNDHLARLIRSTESKYGINTLNEIDDDDLIFVNAAGDINVAKIKDKRDGQ